jgi:Cdc25 family phosphatase
LHRSALVLHSTGSAREMSSDSAPGYISASELHALLSDGSKSGRVLVVDVRDDDFAGGNIAGALNVPSDSFGTRLQDVAAAAKDKDLVVFHCMLSQQRGPAAARAMASHGARSSAAFPRIVILEKGFSGWARYVSGLDEKTRKEQKHLLVADYSPQRYGYEI